MRHIFFKTLIKWFLFILFATHFSLVAFFLTADAATKDDHPYLQKYFQYFSQSWKMFSPPPDFNQRLYVQYVLFKNGKASMTGYYDVITPLNESHWKGNMAVSRIAYFLFNCGAVIFKTDGDVKQAIQKDSTLKHDSLKAKQFYDKNIKSLRPYVFLQEYSYYAYKKLQLGDADSVKARFKVLRLYFPDYEHRYKDYTNLANYKNTLFLSEFYTLANVNSLPTNKL